LVVGYLDRRCHELRRKSFLFEQMRQADFQPDKIFEPILRLPAQQLITASNHLSGVAEPNELDLVLFHKLQTICQAFGLEMLDNVIFSRRGFYSFRQAGLLQPSAS
jgi:DNA repair protein RadC